MDDVRKKQPVDLICVLLALVTLAVYWPVSSYEFLNYDDPYYVTGNPYVQRGPTLDGLAWAFGNLHATGTYWHPVTWLSHMMDCRMFGLNAGAHHLMNAFVHAVNAVLLFLVLRRMTGATWKSAAVAALFALHPLQVDSVAWVTERKNVLSTLFWLLTTGAYVWYTERPGLARYLLALLFFALGLMSKPALVTLPCVLFLLDYWPLRRLPFGQSVAAPDLERFVSPARPRPTLARLVLEKLAFVGLAIASSLITVVSHREMDITEAAYKLSLKLRVENALVSYVRYIDKTLWPADLSVLYPHPGSWPAWQVIGSGLLLALITGLVIRSAWRRPYLAFGWFWFLGVLVPVIGLVQVGYQAMADRFAYVPVIGLFLMMVWGTADLVSRWRCPRSVPVLAAAIVLAGCVVVTWFQLKHWRSSITLFRHALAVTRNNTIAHYNLGEALGRQGNTEEAMSHYAAALRIDSNYVHAHYNWGLLLAMQGKAEEAASHFQSAVRSSPGHWAAHNNLGIVLVDLGRIPEAITHYRECLRLKPDHAEAHNNLALALERQGKLAEAVDHYHEALRINPGLVSVRKNLGLTFSQMGRFEEAAVQFRQVLEASPNDAEVLLNLGKAETEAGNHERAKSCLAEALRLRPGDASAHFYLGLACSRQGSAEKAMEHFGEALRLNPDFAGALNEMAWILATHPNAGMRNGNEAVRLAERACELTARKEAKFLGTLDAAYAEAGRFSEAITTAQHCHQLALASGQKDLADAAEQRLALYRSGQPYRLRSLIRQFPE